MPRLFSKVKIANATTKIVEAVENWLASCGRGTFRKRRGGVERESGRG